MPASFPPPATYTADMGRHFVTYFDRHYCAFGIAMIRSLLRVEAGARITVFCLDAPTTEILQEEFSSRVTCITPAELAALEPEWVGACVKRTPWEAYVMLTAVVMRWMLDRVPPDDMVVYVDADLGFFSDPTPLWDEMAGASIAISPHRFSPSVAKRAKYGVFNAGFLALRNDAHGRQCAGEWTRQCLDWCYHQCTSDGRFMNQGYLTQWPSRYGAVVTLTHPGHNLAWWNVETHPLQAASSGLLVAGQPLLFFHFSSFWCGLSGRWQTSALVPGMGSPLLHDRVFTPHLTEVNAIALVLKQRHGTYGVGSVKRRNPGQWAFDLPVDVPDGLVLPNRSRQWLAFATARLAALLRPLRQGRSGAQSLR